MSSDDEIGVVSQLKSDYGLDTEDKNKDILIIHTRNIIGEVKETEEEPNKTLKEVRKKNSVDNESIDIQETIDQELLLPNNKTGLEKYRFVIVVIYCALNFSNAVNWISFASCSTIVMVLYDIRSLSVNMLSMIFMIVYPFACVPEAYIIDNISMKTGLILAAIFTLLGAGIKCFINYHILFAFIGQFLASLFQPAILNSPAKIAATWFDNKTRVLITSICCGSNTIGVLFGYLVHLPFLDEEKKSKTQFLYYMIGEFILTAILCIPTIIFMRSKPKSPPSLSQDKYTSPPLRESLKLLLKNFEFVKLLISTTCIVGFINIFGTIVTQYLNKYDINNDYSTYTAACANLTAIIASVLVSSILDKNKEYKKILVILNVTGVMFMVILTLLLEVTKEEILKYLALAGYTITISSIVPIYTTAMDYVCEITYPVGESISEGLIMCFNQISGALGIVLCDFFMKELGKFKFLCNCLGIFLFIISLLCIISLKGRLVRNLKDEKIKRNSEEE